MGVAGAGVSRSRWGLKFFCLSQVVNRLALTSNYLTMFLKSEPPCCTRFAVFKTFFDLHDEGSNCS